MSLGEVVIHRDTCDEYEYLRRAAKKLIQERKQSRIVDQDGDVIAELTIGENYA